MKLRRVTLGFSAVALLSLALNALLITLIQRAYDEAVRAQEQRQSALALVNDLQQETEQLVSLVRSYVVTREERYLTYYHDILAVRAGLQTMPLKDAQSAYWKHIIAERADYRGPGKGNGRSVQSRMQVLGFESAEFSALERVQSVTSALQRVEKQAFDAVHGATRDAIEKHVVRDAPTLDVAVALVYSKQYTELQAKLADALTDLSAATERRTHAKVREAQDRLNHLISASMVTLAGSLGLVLIAAWVLQLQVLRPIRRLSSAARNLATGDYSTRVGRRAGLADLDDSFGVEELAALGNAFNSMAGSIERDIQQRVAVQTELEQARSHSDEASRAKSMFLANMSHEIRTPMNAIIGMAYLALHSGLPPRQHDYVSKVHQAAMSLLGLINDILDFSKVEAGKMELSLAPFRLERVLADALALVQQRAQEKRLELVLDLSERELVSGGGMLIGDPLRLGQILTNLLSNAVKFTEQGSVRLTVHVERREEDGVALCFTVRDTGIGMDSIQIGRLFKEFSQADGSTTRKYGGTGLGLAICHKLVHLMGGRIWADSEPGIGTRFSVALRLARASPEPLPTPPVFMTDLRVLIVDDLGATRLALQNLLRAEGVESSIDVVAGLAGARARLEAAHHLRRPYQILLLDWELPEQHGGQWLEQLAKDGVALPPVVALTIGEVSSVAGSGVPLLGRLAKPVQPAELRAMLGRLHTGIVAVDSKPELQTTGLNGMRVLLVEDQAINRELACELLALRGVAVETAEHGAAALERLKAVGPRHFHAVLMDMQMPVMDGYEATRHIRLDPSFGDLPVIAMTAHTLSEERERCAALGMTSHLGKPVDPDQLYEELARHYNADAEFRPKVKEPVQDPSQIPGLDMQAGLHRAGGLHGLYRRLLANFAAEFADAPTVITTRIAENDWTQAEQHAHKLHGVAATLGATEVANVAVQLERDCRRRSQHAARARLEKLTMPLQGVVEAISQLEPPAESAQAERPAPDWIARLQQMLAVCDSRALELWRSSIPAAEQLLGRPTAHRIGTALDNFDFDQALALIEAANG